MPAVPLEPGHRRKDEQDGPGVPRQLTAPVTAPSKGLVDEFSVRGRIMTDIRKNHSYLAAFAGAGAAYQNPKSICPQHQMRMYGSHHRGGRQLVYRRRERCMKKGGP
jgi:hypothetical protein